MQINLESGDTHSIQSYSDSDITVNQTHYSHSVIIGRQEIITPWLVKSVQELTEENMQPILNLNPEVIIIGHSQLGLLPPIQLMQFLSSRQIGLESMSIGAASRTFNVLLGEERAVVAGIVFSK